MASSKTFNKSALQDATKQVLSADRKLLVSYILDWIIILIFAGAGGLLSLVSPHHRPFSLVDLSISNPVVHEQISVGLLGVIAFVVPSILIAIITILFVPGSEVRRTSTRAQVLRIKLWELEKGLAGLCLSVALGFFIVQGTKNMFGKPRPNLLARCDPDLENFAQYVVGSFASELSPEWVLVNSGICRQTDKKWLDDGFRSFPSGHSQWSWSGLLYLTLYFCSKFSVGLPHLPYLPNYNTPATNPRTSHHHPAAAASGGDNELLPLHAHRARGDSEETKYDPHAHPPPSPTTTAHSLLHLRNTAASPPNYLIIPALTPVAVAVYICSTRFVEFYHFGFDIISGSLIGIVTAWLSFRWYHLPISRGRGWAFGARSPGRAFAIGVGTPGYVCEEDWGSGGGGVGGRGKGGDLEAGRV
ncbi:hypothetical protein M409DRAFT_17200 [Zasmidium cellare ATCC 36951]|uniref:Phosphatidic acid phosphatase type 2/haloperoxidase domain-containing protein n=1 Tax=Zasmidium cellare ATCC 36951 TaxID=1080233 RepID=A0A6A6D1F3_ZASCE|nr:uncharacterized protein M409DRAFT_17200 [Zasmidium cellare ATCC 36951]KAF2173257.1 hypothetical protein M409DRAFT_17200 [Zasmidium cellare ATCC 36951]